jgi:23S rRNA pseudouridine1911/1915/1917 synthase
MFSIIYEDNHLIAVRKPHGMLTQGDDTGDVNLLDEVKAFIKERDQKPGNVFLGLLHRLDRPVGGVVLFGKTSKGAARLSEQFRTHAIQKTYWAVVEKRIGLMMTDRTDGEVNEQKDPDARKGLGNPRVTDTVIQWLVKDERINKVTPYDREVVGSQRAELTYAILKTVDDCALVEIYPKTGRPHQIRVAMASKVAPIVGDLKYGAHEGLHGNIALFARSLSFAHPITREDVVVTANPELEIFSLFT